jgi:hypothetical protein
MSRRWLRLSPPASKTNQRVAAAVEIDTAAGTMIDPKLRYALTNRLHVPGVAERQPIDPRLDARLRWAIPQRPKPSRKRLCLANFNPASMSSSGDRCQGRADRNLAVKALLKD